MSDRPAYGKTEVDIATIPCIMPNLMSDHTAPTPDVQAPVEMPRNAWVIVNPNARRGRHNRSVLRDLDECARSYPGWTSRLSMAPGQTEKVAAEAARAEADLLFAAGGDGTIHEVVNGLMPFPPSQRPIVAVMPLGTGNDFAKMLGIPKGVKEAIRAVSAGRTAPVDVGRAGSRWFINDFGAGLVAEAARAYYAMPKILGGSARYFAAFLKATAVNRQAFMRFLVDGSARLEGPLSMAAISNGAWSGGRFPLNPEAKIDDGFLNVCVARALTRGQILKALPSVLRGAHLRHPAVESFPIQSVRIESPDLEVYQLDGELYDFPADGIDISIEPKALRFVFGTGI